MSEASVMGCSSFIVFLFGYKKFGSRSKPAQELREHLVHHKEPSPKDTSTPIAAPQEQTSGMSRVTFQVECETQTGEHVAVVGNSLELGFWDPERSQIPLTTSTSQYPIWKGSFELPASYPLEYKFVVRNQGSARWESIGNRFMSIPDVDLQVNAKFDTAEETFAQRHGKVHLTNDSQGYFRCKYISDAQCQEGDQLTNAFGRDVFSMILIGEDCVAFESVNHPNLFLTVTDATDPESQKIVLGKSGDDKEVFRVITALNGKPEPTWSFESKRSPGSFICHCNGIIYCRARATVTPADRQVFNDSSSWTLIKAEDEGTTQEWLREGVNEGKVEHNVMKEAPPGAIQGLPLEFTAEEENVGQISLKKSQDRQLAYTTATRSRGVFFTL